MEAKKKTFCIVIPVYTEKINLIDEIGIKQLYRMVGKKKYDVYLVCPESLNTDEYFKYYPTLKVSRFDDKFFKDIHMYSQLCINYDFYDRFSDYEYMFLYQLDAYIFRDEIEYWCKQGYDYIGGPIFSELSRWELTNTLNKYQPKVGNGGCSWRKIETFKDITNPNGEFRTTYKLTDDVLQFVDIEDEYFCNIIENYYDIKRPSWQLTTKIVWDVPNEKLYNFAGGLPMAAHGLFHFYNFWKDYILEFNDKKLIDFIKEKESHNVNKFALEKFGDKKVITKQRRIINNFLVNK